MVQISIRGAHLQDLIPVVGQLHGHNLRLGVKTLAHKKHPHTLEIAKKSIQVEMILGDGVLRILRNIILIEWLPLKHFLKRDERVIECHVSL